MITHWLTHLLNLHWRRVFIADDQVIGVDGKRRFSVSLAEIEAILEVTYENPAAFDTDEFCVLLLKEKFFLIGERTKNGLGIINEIKVHKPSINIIPVYFEQIPWRLRDQGCLGLRLFDLAGMGIFPLHYLPKYIPHNNRQVPSQLLEHT